ncbi:hypothetical protein ACFXA3_19925, partial [Streptomyces sp. NPDC059456]
MQIFGVDIGGSGIKGAPADLDRGELAQERHKVLTPQPAPPPRGGARGGRRPPAGCARAACAAGHPRTRSRRPHRTVRLRGSAAGPA